MTIHGVPIAPLTFTPSLLGSESVRLGDKLIGHLVPVQRGARGAPRAAVLLMLPDLGRHQWPAPSIDAAREIAEGLIAAWLHDAGLTARGSR